MKDWLCINCGITLERMNERECTRRSGEHDMVLRQDYDSIKKTTQSNRESVGMNDPIIVTELRMLVEECHKNSRDKGFWDGPENDNIPTKIALMHSELSEMLEAFRNGNPPCEKPIDVDTQSFISIRRISSIEEEAADLFIRLCDFCGRYEIDLGTVTLAKMAYNSTRAKMHGGKKV